MLVCHSNCKPLVFYSGKHFLSGIYYNNNGATNSNGSAEYQNLLQIPNLTLKH